MSLLYNSSANKLNKVLICFYQRFVPSVLWFTSWDLLWHKLDRSNIFSPSKLIWAQAPLRIYKLCLQSWLQAFWRMTTLPLIYNRLKIAVCLPFSEIAFFLQFLGIQMVVLCVSWPNTKMKKKTAAFSCWLTKGATEAHALLAFNHPSLSSEDQN